MRLLNIDFIILQDQTLNFNQNDRQILLYFNYMKLNFPSRCGGQLLVRVLVTAQTIQDLGQGIHTLYISLCDIEPGAIRELSKRRLNSLHFKNCLIPIKYIEPDGNITALESLTLEKSFFLPEQLQYLHQFVCRLQNLTVLNISSGDLNDTSLSYIARLKLLANLNIDGNCFSSQGLLHLRKLQNLRRLSLRSNNIRDQGLKALAVIPNLGAIDMFENHITFEGAIIIVKLTNLRQVELGLNPIGDVGAKYLPRLIKLRDYSLYRNQQTKWGTMVTDRRIAFRKNR